MYAIKNMLKNKKYKNRMLASSSEAFEASKKEVELAGHTRLSK